MTLVLDGLETPKSTWPNDDLWSELVRLVHQFGRDRLFFAKVAAHVAEEDCDSSLDEWFSIGNSAADRAAKQANVGRPDEVWCLWERHASEVCGNRRLAASIRQHQVAVCRLWTDQFGHLSSRLSLNRHEFLLRDFNMQGQKWRCVLPWLNFLVTVLLNS